MTPAPASPSSAATPARPDVTVRPAQPSDATALADLAALTFPDASPHWMPPEAVAAFVDEQLSSVAFEGYLRSPAHRVLVAVGPDGGLLGYTMTLTPDGHTPEPEVRQAVGDASVAYLSKMYAHPGARGSGVARTLMRSTLDALAREGSRHAWLGVNVENERALAFYRREGFRRVGSRRFRVGEHLADDHVLLVDLSASGRQPDGPAAGRRYLEVDVFSTGPFTGNPLAVVADAEGMSDAQMQAVAAWTGFSETTFLLPPTDPAADYRVRIFTPHEEFDFAGHPTLGSARAWLHLRGEEAGRGEAGVEEKSESDGTGRAESRDRTGTTETRRLVQECGVGLVPVTVDPEGVLAFATPPLHRSGPLEEADVQRLAEALGVERDEILDHAWGDNGPGWRLVRLCDADAVRALRPRGHEDLKVGVVGLEEAGAQTAEPQDAPAYEVRAFAYGSEDPVTGSLNGAAAQWLRGQGLVPSTYTVAQGSQVGRRGRVHVHDDGQDIWVGGRAEVLVDGRLRV